MGGARLLYSVHARVLTLLGCVLVGVWSGDDQNISIITSPELYMEPRPEITHSDVINTPPPPSPPSIITAPYLLLPMFHHQSSPAVHKELFTPVSGSRRIPSAVAAILIPQNVQIPIRVTPVNNNHGVEVWCGYTAITVRIDLALLNFRSSAAYFRLGTCPASRADGSIVYFRYSVNECGSSISVVNGQLLYSNELVYEPERQGPVITAVPLALAVQCAYNRFHYSYKIGYLPEFPLRSFTKTLSRKQIFSLTLRNEKWEELVENTPYVLGEWMYFEAGVSVISQDERVYVEACHVTASEDSNSTQCFDVISNFGCMVDSVRTGSRSHFISRRRNVLRFSLDAFSFAESERFYLHCTVVVGTSSASVTAKSCTYSASAERWEELDGDGAVCSCCDSECVSPGFADAASRIEQVLISSTSWSFSHNVSSQSPEEIPNTSPGFVMFHRPGDPEWAESHAEQEEEEEAVSGDELEEEVLVGAAEMLNDEMSDGENDKVQKEKKKMKARRNGWRSSPKEPRKTKPVRRGTRRRLSLRRRGS